MTEATAYVIPTGGAIGLTLAGTGAWTISRAVSGAGGLGSFMQIGSGAFVKPGATNFFLDVGDMLPGPLLPSGLYVYSFTDGDGTVQTPPLTPVASVTLDPDPLNAILIKMLQGFINALQPPSKISRPQVMSAMPLQGWPPLPLLVVYDELLQQAEKPIGKDVPTPDQTTGTWVNSELVRRVFRISILATNTEERRFYRDAVIGFFKVALAYFLSAVGQDVRQEYQAASYQVTGDNQSMSPGFFGCDISLEISGVFNIAIASTYGVIHTITTTAGSGDFQGQETTVTVQVSG